jgi:hypothetical protein
MLKIKLRGKKLIKQRKTTRYNSQNHDMRH